MREFEVTIRVGRDDRPPFARRERFRVLLGEEPAALAATAALRLAGQAEPEADFSVVSVRPISLDREQLG